MVDLFSGQKLMNKAGGLLNAQEALKEKIVGLYFSAQWSPPCRRFTPILSDFYKELVTDGDPPAEFEIVFLSSDRTSENMVKYYRDVHGDWLALPWEQRDHRKKMMQLYDIKGYPSLVIVKMNGDVITKDGRKQVQDLGPECFKSWSDNKDDGAP